MRSGTREVHWDSPMPPATSRYHSPAKSSDSLTHLKKAARRKPGAGGVVCADVNELAFTTADGIDVVCGGHWGNPWQNGYRYLLTDGTPKRRRKAWLRRPYDQFTYEELKRLRRPNGDPVMEHAEIIEWCADHGLIPCMERKSTAFGLSSKWAMLCNSVCREYDVPDWSMALLSMKNCREKAAQAFAAGGRFAIILGNSWKRDSRQLPPGWPWNPEPEVWNAHAKWWQKVGPKPPAPGPPPPAPKPPKPSPSPAPQPPEKPMPTSQNGWPALASDSSKLHTWVIPACNGVTRIRLRNGSAGFILAHFALWFAEKVQPLNGKILDDWGWAWRPVRGQTSGLSNHASGTAMDLNATQHPLGRVGTFSALLSARIRGQLVWSGYRGTIRGGINYTGRKDEMHFEINRDLSTCERVAKRLLKTKRGKRLLKANPGQDKVIFS